MTAADPSPRRRVLVASLGLSPQGVTETLHALWAGEGWLPERLVIIATPRAADLARRVLLAPGRSAIEDWAREWGVPCSAGLVGEAELVVAPSDSGDVDEDHGAALLAECAFRVLSRLTADPASELHVSIAGGRKPAAALLGVLMAILGRTQDRMSHVLVRPEAAAAAGLYFPARASRQVLAGGGTTIDAADLDLALIDIPFPRLALGAAGSEGLRDFFARLPREGGRARLAVDLGAGTLLWDGTTIALPPAIAAFVAWIALAQAGGAEGVPRVGAPRRDYLAAYGAFAPGAAAFRAAARLADPLEPEWMEEKVARTNKLADACGIRPRGARLLQASGPRARAVYRLALDRGEIRVTGAAGMEAGG